MKQEISSIQQSFNPNVVEADMHFVGDLRTISQVVQLVAYIRNAVKNNKKTDINVRIGRNVDNSDFSFDVNGIAIPNYITQDFIEIN